ncbi:hypothetical protein AHiyo8_04010 [Arthrobacter sp. Hiyo8]|nr:hypothetical protein AHiyo8_04010 [Arthrobacter sp. Hiyo8]
MRYPKLWEAVRTTWHREASERSSPARVLAEHMNYILMNRYRRERQLGGNVWDGLAPTSEVDRPTVRWQCGLTASKCRVWRWTRTVRVRGGCIPRTGGVVTAVLPRDELKYIRIEFAKRTSAQ